MKKIVLAFLFVWMLSGLAIASNYPRLGVAGQFGILMDHFNTSELNDIPRVSNDSDDSSIAFGGYVFIEQRVSGEEGGTRKNFIGLKAGYDKHTNANIDVSRPASGSSHSIAIFSRSWAQSYPVILYYKMKRRDFSWFFGGGITYYQVGWKDSKWTDYTDPYENASADDVSKNKMLTTLTVGMEYDIVKNFAVEAGCEVNFGYAKADNNIVYVTKGSSRTNIYRDSSSFNIKFAVRYYIF